VLQSKTIFTMVITTQSYFDLVFILQQDDNITPHVLKATSKL